MNCHFKPLPYLTNVSSGNVDVRTMPVVCYAPSNIPGQQVNMMGMLPLQKERYQSCQHTDSHPTCNYSTDAAHDAKVLELATAQQSETHPYSSISVHMWVTYMASTAPPTLTQRNDSSLMLDARPKYQYRCVCHQPQCYSEFGSIE